MDRLQQQVTFRFGQDMDVRYLSTVPAIGDLVTHASALWVVSSVEVDDRGTIVTCEIPAGGVGHLERV